MPHQRQVVRHAKAKAGNLLQNIPGDLIRAVGVRRECRDRERRGGKLERRAVEGDGREAWGEAGKEGGGRG